MQIALLLALAIGTLWLGAATADGVYATLAVFNEALCSKR